MPDHQTLAELLQEVEDAIFEELERDPDQAHPRRRDRLANDTADSCTPSDDWDIFALAAERISLGAPRGHLENIPAAMIIRTNLAELLTAEAMTAIERWADDAENAADAEAEAEAYFAEEDTEE